MMKRVLCWTSVAGVALALASGCSQGAPGNPSPGFPPQGPGGPQPTSDDGPSTFGDDGGGGGCCVAHESPGCDAGFIEACVCGEIPRCCGEEWSSECAAAVESLGCGSCDPGQPDTGTDPDESGGPPVGQDCCAAGNQPGCNDPEIESCVCSEIDFCCDTGWEKVCASAVEALHCGNCGGVGETGDPPPGETGDPPPGDTGDPPPPPMAGCCEVQMTPGCTDAAVQDCVCAQDDFCCTTEWDQVCVDEVGEFMCGDCGGGMPPPGVSPCCEAQAGGGCGDPAIEQCVCAIDDFCCTTEWDSVCAVFVTLFLCATC